MDTQVVHSGVLERATLTPQEYINLRKNAEASLANSLVCFVKRVDGKAVGAVRAVGDGRLCFYIQDLMVMKGSRRNGIATELMYAVTQSSRMQHPMHLLA